MPVKHATAAWSGTFVSAPVPSLLFRTGGTYAKHSFIEYEDKGTQYGGNRMNGALK